MATQKPLRDLHTNVIYQIYPRSFQDSNGDGVGDICGIIQRIPYLAQLGVDYIWISPFLKSPMKDFGYDVSNYMEVDPVFGTNDDLDRLISVAEDHGLKIMMDLVLAHTSMEHQWFKESRESRTNPKADWYVWADAKPDGTPPNNWLAVFGGPAWIWESRREQYYLTHFLKDQPAVNLYNDDVKNQFKEVLRYWLNKGVRGFRFDAIHCAHYDRKLRNNPAKPRGAGPEFLGDTHPFGRQIHRYDWAQSPTTGFLKELRDVCNNYEDIVLLGEVGGEPSLKVARDYTRSNRLHLGYTFDLIAYPEKLDATGVRKLVDKVIGYFPGGGYSWALGNHDSKRLVSKVEPERPDLHPAVASCYIALLASLPGSACIYQGDELGLPQAAVGYDDLQDPYDKEFYPKHVGRDGARTPFPWNENAPMAGFSTAQKTWLPIAQTHFSLSAFQQEENPVSTLNAARAMLAFRKESVALRRGGFEWVESDGYLAFTRTYRNQKIHMIFNLSSENRMLTVIPKGEKADLGTIYSTNEGMLMPPYSYGLWVER